ncbi:MAG: hypothetical protein ACKN9A_00635, partial [Microcystis aeruginosa]
SAKKSVKLWKKKESKIVYLHPYSLDFTSIENFCPKAKSILGKLQPKNYRDLNKALEEAFRSVSKKDTRNCCNLCHYTSSVREKL